MPSIALHTGPLNKSHDTPATTKPTNALPTLLQTPSGLAIIEIQGTIHAPFPSPSETDDSTSATQTPIGRLEFPLYDPNLPDDTKWMKKVFLYVGRHQRLVGEVKKLAKPLAVVQMRGGEGEAEDRMADRRYKVDEIEKEALEIAEVIKWKVIFQGRPEPV